MRKAENKILSSLANGKPAPSVLNEAKNAMNEGKRPFFRKAIFRYGIIFCLVLAVSLAIILPLTLRKGSNSNSQYTVVSYSSLYDYATENNIKITPLDKLFEGDMSMEVSSPGAFNPFFQEECNIIKYGGEDVILTEKYNVLGGTSDELSVLLVEDNLIKNDFFSDFSDLSCHSKVKKIQFDYEYFEEEGQGRACFTLDGKECFLTVQANDLTTFITHVQIFLMYQ